VEKECLRVRADGHVSMRPHPESFGSALTHPHLTTDYSEALLEFVTPPHLSNWETLQFLCDLHGFVHRGLEDELLWPASMPCIVNPDEEIPIAGYGGSNPGQMRTVYRRGLGFRYGRAMQAIAGAHFNYSPPEELWEAYREALHSKEAVLDFKSRHLMGLVRNYRRYAWLVIYLFGASPAFCKSFRPEGHELLSELDASTWYAPFATSLRMSDMGYRNKDQARLSISANSLAQYIAALESAVTTVDPKYEAIGVAVNGEYRQLNANILQIENEYYSSIRPKPRQGTQRITTGLKEGGVEYVEVRTLDLQIGDPVGLNQNQLRFLEAFLLYCLLTESPSMNAAEEREIDARDLLIARQGRMPKLVIARSDAETSVIDWGLELLDGIAEVAALLDEHDEGYAAAIESSREALLDPERTPSAQLMADLRDSGLGFYDYALDLARRHHDYFVSLSLGPDKEQSMAQIARRSITESENLERNSSVPFDEYLSQYFEQA